MTCTPSLGCGQKGLFGDDLLKYMAQLFWCGETLFDNCKRRKTTDWKTHNITTPNVRKRESGHTLEREPAGGKWDEEEEGKVTVKSHNLWLISNRFQLEQQRTGKPEGGRDGVGGVHFHPASLKNTHTRAHTQAHTQTRTCMEQSFPAGAQFVFGLTYAIILVQYDLSSDWG